MGAFIVILCLMQITAILSELPLIQKCQLTDPICLTKAAQHTIPSFVSGIPELGVETLDPMHIDRIHFELAGLKLTMKECNIDGVKHSVIDKISFDTSKKIMHLNVHSNITMKSKYKAGGRLLILPITGDGDATLVIKNLVLSYSIRYKITQDKNGKDVFDLQANDYTFENNEYNRYKLTNLFNGNKELSDAMHTFMNENWKAISQEFAAPVIDKPAQKIYTAVKQYLKSQPIENIVLNYVHKN